MPLVSIGPRLGVLFGHFSCFSQCVGFQRVVSAVPWALRCICSSNTCCCGGHVVSVVVRAMLCNSAQLRTILHHSYVHIFIHMFGMCVCFYAHLWDVSMRLTCDIIISFLGQWECQVFPSSGPSQESGSREPIGSLFPETRRAGSVDGRVGGVSSRGGGGGRSSGSERWQCKERLLRDGCYHLFERMSASVLREFRK